MLSHQQPYLWQVMHLSAFIEPACYSFQRLLAVAADHRAMMYYLIRTDYLYQGTPSMPWLPSRLLLAPVALAPLLSSWAITRRRFAVVVTILGQTPLQVHQTDQHLLSQLPIVCSQGRILRWLRR